MIQRIQSIYLLLSTAAIALFNFLPLGIDETPEPDIIAMAPNFIELFGIAIGIGAISLINTFLFKNRKLQMNICKLTMVLILGLIGASAYFLLGVPETTIESPHVGLIMPLFALIFSFLAMKKIGQDEKLVRSIDRLR